MPPTFTKRFPPSTIGLVFTGGKSSRMHQDKSLLNYHGQPQRQHLLHLLQPFCEEVWLCCNATQAAGMNPELPFLMDDPVWGDIGPMAGLLTAAKKFSGKNLLTIGCDYPFFNHAALELLATVCKPEKSAAFYNPATHFYEPLLAFYPAVVLQEMETLWGQQQFSLQQFLRAIPAIRCIPDDPKIIQSIDTPEAAMAVRKIFR